MTHSINCRILFCFFLLTFFAPSCKKAVDKAQENAAFEIITNGRWQVTKMDVDGAATLPEYAGFEFQFFTNGVVTAFKTGSPSVNGVWSADATSLSITSNFPVTTNPLRRFNGVWLITRTTETTVQATRTDAGVVYLLGLKKI